jgi:hypothetical protein
MAAHAVMQLILVKLERLDSLSLTVEAVWADLWEIERLARVVRKPLKAAGVAVINFGFAPGSAARESAEALRQPKSPVTGLPGF